MLRVREEMYFKSFCIITVLSLLAIDFAQIRYAGVYKKEELQNVLPRDAIPAIKNPEYVSADGAGLDDDELVIGITINGESRAYSVYLMNHHEVVNDRIGDTAFAVTWCPLANLAAVYNREIDGKEYSFGVSGKLLKNTLVMFDYETESFWPIVYGEAILGKLTGRKLDELPGYQKAPWGAWKNYTRTLLFYHTVAPGQLVTMLTKTIIIMNKREYRLP